MPSTSWEFLSLTDQVYGSNYRNDKEYQSDGYWIFVQRKRNFLHNICGKELQIWVQHSLDRPVRILTSWFDCEDIVACVLRFEEILLFFQIIVPDSRLWFWIRDYSVSLYLSHSYCKEWKNWLDDKAEHHIT